jgi:hypothetical protein
VGDSAPPPRPARPDTAFRHRRAADRDRVHAALRWSRTCWLPPLPAYSVVCNSRCRPRRSGHGVRRRWAAQSQDDKLTYPEIEAKLGLAKDTACIDNAA